jgi:hypothetical protein
MNEDVNEDSDPHQSSNSNPPSPQDRHLNADSKHRHHLLSQDKTAPPQRTEHSNRDWIAANVEKVRYNSLKILNLREGATEGE